MLQPFADNPLRSREDLQQTVLALCRPLEAFFSPGKARVTLGHTGAHFLERAAQLEGFARPLWGLVPLAAGGGKFDGWNTYCEGLAHGSDPQHSEYWGDAMDVDQSLVEMAAIGLALALVPDKIWQPLADRDKQSLAHWLDGINRVKVADNNWLFFRVLVNLGLKTVGAAYSSEAMETSLERLEDFYQDDGWYSDGPSRQYDYYIAFAMHFYGLIYARLAATSDPVRSGRFKERAARFAQDFIYWFDANGAALPFGRSLTYRFAQSSFWGALAFAEVEALPWGVIKGLALRNLRWWSRQPIFDNAGILTIGYAYPNLHMAETYNSPGSPYWALKFFLPLALPASHPFWQAEEAPLPSLELVHAQKHPGVVICRDEAAQHIFALSSGQEALWCRHNGAKYTKLAYSSVFGFSVTSTQPGLSQGAFDNALALSDDNRFFRSRESCLEARLDGTTLYSRWQPWPDVEVETWLLPVLPWHVRVHRLRTARLLYSAEGGFAIPRPADRPSRAGQGVQNQPNASLVQNFFGLSGLQDLTGNRQGEAQFADPNTNLLYQRTVIPTLLGNHPPGEHWLACAVLAMPEAATVTVKIWNEPPVIKQDEQAIHLYYRAKLLKEFR